MNETILLRYQSSGSGFFEMDCGRAMRVVDIKFFLGSPFIHQRDYITDTLRSRLHIMKALTFLKLSLYNIYVIYNHSTISKQINIITYFINNSYILICIN